MNDSTRLLAAASDETATGTREHDGPTPLSRPACLELLASRTIGRIAITDRALPVILPVNYALLDEDVVFATDRGSKLDAAVLRSVVAFETDEVDEDLRTGWSVCVTGTAEELVRADQIERAEALDIRPLAHLEHRRYVRVRSDLISGRRL